MGHFSFSTEKTGVGCGKIDAAPAVSLLLQGVSTGPCSLESQHPAFPSLHFRRCIGCLSRWSVTAAQVLSQLVITFMVEGENPWGIFAESGLSALRRPCREAGGRTSMRWK
jgi:hypothetical protein